MTTDRNDTVEAWQRAGALTWDWVWPVAVVLTGLWLAAPRLEAAVAPILGPQTIDDVVRTPSRLCWTRLSEKLRSAPIDNYDVFLDRRSASGAMVRSFPEIFLEDSGAPLATDRAPPPGWSRRRLCILLPPDVRPEQPIQLRQTIHFLGLLSLWDVPLPLPTITDPPGSILPP